MPFAQSSGSPLGTIFATVVVLLAVALLIGVVAIARKRIFGYDADVDGGLTLGGMRDLVRQGKMTPEEFEKTKALIVAAALKKSQAEALEVKPDGTPRRPRGDADDDAGGGLMM